jgi:hypothetical protein
MVKRTNPFAKYALSAKKARKYQRQPYSMAITSRRSTAELKTVDTTVGHGAGVTLACNTTGLLTAINLIQNGSQFYQRVGRRIEMRSLHLNGVLTQTGNPTTTNDYVRVMVVYDRQPNAATPGINSVLQSYDQVGTQTFSSLSGINPDERERWLVLADHRLVLPQVNTTTSTDGSVEGTSSTFNINRFIKLKNLKTHYTGDTNPAVIGDISTGALYVLTIGSYAAGTEGWQLQACWRLRYTDT